MTVMKRNPLDALRPLARELRVSRETLSQNMAEQAELFYHYGILMNRAQRAAKAASLELQKVEAKMHRRLSREHSRVTERMVMAACFASKTWRAATRRADRAAEIAGAFDIACKAMLHRKDMLVNISATVRAEMESELRTRQRDFQNERAR